ncbi:MAG: extracellular solute-binding protein, partial [Firmicutes bacterium]|nr:extracellular solute-binding protein [Bacillota bacterium]
MKHKKRLAMMLALVMVILSLATGCHGSKGMAEFVIPEEFDTSRDYEITFWAKNDTNLTQVGIYKQAIEDFRKLYPNITVKLKLYTDYGRIYNDVITNISTDTTPNVCITYPDHIATYLTGADTVVPLNDLFANEKYGLGGNELNFDSPTLEEIIQQFLNECEF